MKKNAFARMVRAGRGDGRSPSTSVAVAATAALIVLCAQFLTIRFNRQGNWTALFCTGARNALPAGIEGEGIYRFPDTGYDGAFYHVIAHDPFLEHGSAQYIDNPRLRYRRILVPLMAFLLAGGSRPFLDSAIISVVLFWTFMGSYWLSRWVALATTRSSLWGFAFLAIPATIVSADRLAVDVALLALCAGFALALERGRLASLYAVLALAPLVRETGLLLALAVCLWRMGRREWRRSAFFASSMIPCVAWYAYVQGHTEAAEFETFSIPLSGILFALSHPAAYADKLVVIARLDRITDALALMGAGLAFGLTLWKSRKGINGPLELAGVLFAILGVCLQGRLYWTHVYDFGRVYSPLLLILGLDWLRSGGRVQLLPLLLMYPRIFLQLGSVAIGVVTGLARLVAR